MQNRVTVLPKLLGKRFLLTLALIVGGCFSSSPVLAQSIFENVRVSPQFLRQPVTMRGISGGSVPARQISGQAETETGRCVGFVDLEPDHTITLTSFFDYLNLQVRSSGDTILVIMGPGGTWCNDDYSNDQNPGISGQWLEGIYQIWIGSYHQNNYHPYVIKVSKQAK